MHTLKPTLRFSTRLLSSFAVIFAIFLMLTMRIVQAQAVPVMHFECDDTSFRACYIAWHPQNDWLAIRQLYHIQLWDNGNDTYIGEFMHEGSNVVVWTPDGTALTTVGIGEILVEDGHILRQGAYIRWLRELDEKGLRSSTYIGDIEAMSWNPDGTQLAFITGDYLAVWNVEVNEFEMVNTPEDRYWADDTPIGVDWSPDGSTIALASSKQLSLIDADTFEVLLAINYPSGVVSQQYTGFAGLAWSPNGQRVAVTAHSDLISRDMRPASVLLFDLNTEEFALTFETESRLVSAVAWSPDGRWLASANSYYSYSNEEYAYDENSVRIWDTEHDELAQIITFDSPVYMVDWSADGCYLATSTFSGDIDIWAIHLD